MTCVQHIVGNTLITTSQPTQPQTHQILNPVSIHQIQPTSAQNGQHFLVNAQQWQPQTQQFQQLSSQNGGMQSFHLTTAQPLRNPNNPNEIVVSNQAIIGSTNATAQTQPQQQIIFNPHIPAPVTGMQVQLQPIVSATQQTVMQTTLSDGQHQILDSCSQAGQSQQMLMPSVYTLSTIGQDNTPQPVPPPPPVCAFIY